MRRVVVFIAVGIALYASPAWSQTCTTFAVQTGQLPIMLTGKIAYEDETVNPNENIDHFLYVYDFSKGGSPTKVPLTDINGVALSGQENPVFTPDGSAILFAAISTVNDNQEFDLFYWNITSGKNPTNITSSMGNNRDEDVKFSPDGNSIVWKEATGIVTANFSVDAQGNPIISNEKMLVGGQIGTSNEKSGPVFSPDQKYVYYYLGDAAPFSVQRYDSASTSTPTSEAFPQDLSLTHYYPVYPDLYNFMYVGWLPQTSTTCPTTSPILKCYDKVFVRAKLPAAGTAWNATDCVADNSDPAPVDADHFIYSRDNNPDGTTSYELYLGEISSGKSWSLSSFGINISGGSFVGSNYTGLMSAPAARRTGGLP